MNNNCTRLIRGVDCHSTTTTGGWVRIPDESQWNGGAEDGVNTDIPRRVNRTETEHYY